MSKTERRKTEDVIDYVRVDEKQPHIANLNQDPQLSRKVNYSLEENQTKIGKRNEDPKNNIEIGGMGIRKLHAVIKNVENTFYMQPVFEGEESGCYLNGDMILKETQIFHLDRISFGTNNMFLLLIPDTQPRDAVIESSIDWDFAQN